MNHTSIEELVKKQKGAQSNVEIDATYAHYRNADLKYKVIAIGLQEATEKVCVIYQALYGDKLTWVRDLDSWLSEVDLQGKKVARFKKIS